MIIEKTLTGEYSYFCSKCLYEWRSIQRLVAPKCPKCSGLLNQDKIDIDFNKYTKMEDQFFTMYNDSCSGCPNHPKNNGSGICHCILGDRISY